MKLLSLSEKKRALDFSIGNRHMIRAILWNLRFARRRGYDRSEKKMFGRNPKEENEETGEIWYSNYVIAGRSCSFRIRVDRARASSAKALSSRRAAEIKRSGT